MRASRKIVCALFCSDLREDRAGVDFLRFSHVARGQDARDTACEMREDEDGKRGQGRRAGNEIDGARDREMLGGEEGVAAGDDFRCAGRAAGERHEGGLIGGDVCDRRFVAILFGRRIAQGTAIRN